jgi:Ca2+-binding EF-hand superfamily protein
MILKMKGIIMIIIIIIKVGELLGTLGTNLNEEELHKLVKLMDKDGSGEVCMCVCVCV